MEEPAGAVPQYSKEWLQNNAILCYRFKDLSPATVDAWGNDLSAELNNWSAEKPWRLLLDIRMKGNIVSPYALRRSYTISRLRPELPGRLAILISSRLAAEIISAAMRAAGNNYRQRQAFVVQAVAVSWLLAS
ncbi:MAG: hypothetical protein K8I60_15145 [Anaerolineae bacterium]|nr:hypothetical protein [Anaerolineae bacterium]